MKLLSFSVPLFFLLTPGMSLSLISAERPVPLPQPAPARQVSPPNSINLIRPSYIQDVLPIFMGKCSRCHNDQATFLRNWLDYYSAAGHRWEIKERVWDSWRGAFFKQPMPAGNSPESLAMTEQERRTIRQWVERGAPYGVPSAAGPLQSKAERMEAGRTLFTTICAACHQPTGYGIPGRFPPLAGSDFLNVDKHRAIRIVLNGLQGEVVVNGQKFNNSMPKLPLRDEDIANALTFVYSSFGNSGQDVTPAEVNSLRTEPPDAPSPTGPGTASRPIEEKSPWE